MSTIASMPDKEFYDRYCALVLFEDEGCEERKLFDAELSRRTPSLLDLMKSAKEQK